MSELTNLKKSRSAHRNAVHKLVKKAIETMKEEMNDDIRLDLEVLLRAIKTKEVILQKLDEDIVSLTEEDAFDDEIETSTDLSLKLMKDITVIERFLNKQRKDENTTDVKLKRSSLSNEATGVKLPKIYIKKFSGDPTAWQQFIETFDATVDKNDKISNIEKFSYLKGYLTGAAEKCIEGLSLTSDNYEEAVKLLKERYGNPQLVIASHMDKILKTEKVSSNRNCKDLRRLYDQIESHVRSLNTVGVKSEHFGPLLIPIVLEKVPDEIKLTISRELGKNNWKIDDFMNVLKNEITARENCEFISQKRPVTEKVENDAHFSTEALLTGNKMVTCVFCYQNHYSDKCNLVTDVERRKEMVRKNRLCFKCLGTGHPIRRCRSRYNCYRCKSSHHHTAICDKALRENKVPKKAEHEEESFASLVNSQTSILLQTASGIIADTREVKSRDIKILLDPGSQRSYITNRIVKQTNLKPVDRRTMNVKTFGDEKGKIEELNEFEFCVKNPSRGCTVYMKGYAVPVICSPLSNQRVDIAEKLFPMLKGLDLSDNIKDPREVDLLIGSDFYWQFIEGETRRCNEDGLTALNSKLGWILSGPFNEKFGAKTDAHLCDAHVFKVAMDFEEEEKNLEKMVQKFWQLDNLGIPKVEPSVYDNFKKGVRFVDGRYEVCLPFRENRPEIEDNYKLSENRLVSLKKKLDKNKELLKEYDDVIQEQVRSGVIEKAEMEPVLGKVTYLPHRAVVRGERKTTKVRVVFDASAKNRGNSLNECLMKGPSLNPLLLDILLRFRAGNIGLIADIEKAYLQISVNPNERDFLRFLWYEDVMKDNPKILKYRFTRVIFGATCSQFLLNGIIKLHVEKYKEVDEKFTEKVLRSFYVDDLNSCVQTKEEGVEFYKKIKLRFSEAKFMVRKWRTSDEMLRKFIAEKEKGEHDLKNDLTGDKVLGIKWDEEKDELSLDVKEYVNEALKIKPTKRNVLGLIASVYDPVGFIQPMTVRLKMFFQEICMAKFDWDTVLSDDFKEKWSTLIDELKNFPEIIVSRAYCICDFEDPFEKIEMYGFADSSTVAFGGVIYLKFLKRSGEVSVSFVTAKSQLVSRNKTMNIHRLELLGNLMLSKLVVNVFRALETEMEISKTTCFSDSQVALGWIRAESKEFKTFVQNRVTTIRKNVPIKEWKYCPSEKNAADILTRNNSKQIIHWLSGPEYLRNSNEHDVESCFGDDFELPEIKETDNKNNDAVLITISPEVNYIGDLINITRYNELNKLLRVTAYVIRFCKNIKGKVENRSLHILNSMEINEAKIAWFKDNQRSININNKNDHIIVNLNLKYDEHGILRTYSRLKNVCLPLGMKSPVFIDRNHKLAELIVYASHQNVLHRGVKQTLTELRSNFWIMRGRSFVKKLLRNCTVCRRINVRPYEYPSHSDIPKERFNDTTPFNCTGTDYLGPILCLPVFGEGNKMYKASIVLYTCLSTRAILLEVVHNATASTFISSLTRFIGRRGCPVVIFSDNGSVYKADVTQEFAANRGIKWKFITEGAPWKGGAWERLVASVKRCLKKIIGTKNVTYIELQTIIIEIESILNNRPLCADYDDDVEEILTPNHLLFGRRLENFNLDITEENLVNKNWNKRKRFLELLLNQFWKNWKKEYLTSLRESQRTKVGKKSLKISDNDIVIVYDEKLPRHVWQIGRVTKLIASGDGVVRSAAVKLAKSGIEINRPVNKLYPLLPSADKKDINLLVTGSVR